MSDTASVHVFGIRHHGPGSARSLRQALEELRPDAILIEGPPDAEGLIPSVVHEQMQPPVAILIYVPEDPKVAAYYPFAVFSPEWQALRYGLETGCTLRFIDLPQMHRMAMRKDEGAGMRDEEGASGSETPALPGEPEAAPDEGAEANAPDEGVHPSSLLPHPSHDPLGWLAQAAGYSDGERWWDHLVEQRRDGADLFAAVLEGMTVLRESVAPDADPVEAQREAYMRQCIRRAKKDGFQRIAVVCGAWHAPALVKLPPAKEDTALLQGLPKNRRRTR